MAAMIEGAEAWSTGDGEAGVLVLHGFTGNPVSLRPLAESLAAAGFAVEMPLLPGHGTSWQDLQRTTWRDWAREAIAGFERLRARTDRQVAVGLSMGAALALHLAETRGGDLSGLVLINPAVRNDDPKGRLLPVAKYLVASIPAIGNDIAKPGGDEKPYPRTPLKALHSMFRFQALVRRNLGAVTTPALVLTSRQDHVVAPGNSTIVLDGISSPDKRQVWLERSYHVATLDHDADGIAAATIEFVRRVTAP
ncbi:alpha/beta fold hydrolase [soil metagenome]